MISSREETKTLELKRIGPWNVQELPETRLVQTTLEDKRVDHFSHGINLHDTEEDRNNQGHEFQDGPSLMKLS